MCVVFVALGSRGDVQPLAVLASRLAAETPVALVSHKELAKLKADPMVLSASVDFRALSQPCFMDGDAPDILDLQGRRRSEWIEAISMALDAELLVCNLFAMPPVYHLSERALEEPQKEILPPRLGHTVDLLLSKLNPLQDAFKVS